MAEIEHEAGAKVPPIKIYSDKFTGHVVLITGFSAGIGETTARLFAQQGAQVVGLDVDEEGMNRVQASIKESGGKIDARKCDIVDEQQVSSAITWAIEKYSKIDVLANCAGIYPFHSIKDFPTEMYHRVIAINLNGSFFLTREILPHMEKAGYGRIVHISSATFGDPQPGLTAYVASKGGVIGLVRSAALEAGPGVTVNAVMPGLIATDRVKSFAGSEQFFEKIISGQVVKRKGHPLDIAHTICFLASPEAAFFSGNFFMLLGRSTWLEHRNEPYVEAMAVHPAMEDCNYSSDSAKDA